MSFESRLLSLKNNIQPNNSTNDSKNTNNDFTKKDFSLNMTEFMNTQVVNIYSRPWFKLEINLKKKKISEFLLAAKLKFNISDTVYENLVKDIDYAFKMNKLNKGTHVKYDKEKTEILEIKGLTIEENKFNLNFK